MLFYLCLLLLGATAFAENLRSNDILQLDVAYEGSNSVGYRFIRDPLHPNSKHAVAVQVAYPLPASSSPGKQANFCQVQTVHRYREDNHIMIDSVNYEVSHHRKKHFLLLTAADGSVLKLSETNATRHCLLPLNTHFEGSDGVGYRFSHDATQPSNKSVISVHTTSMSYIERGWTGYYISPYFCMSNTYAASKLKGNRLKVGNHEFTMTASVNNNHHIEHYVLQSTIDASRSITLTAASASPACLSEEPRLVSAFPVGFSNTSLFIDLVSAAPNNQYVGWTDHRWPDDVFSGQFHDIATGAFVSQSTIPRSAAAVAACPQCIYFLGWDGVNNWFTANRFPRPINPVIQLVNADTGQFLSMDNSDYTPSFRVSQTYVTTYAYNTGVENNHIRMYKKSDGSLHRDLVLPWFYGAECESAFLSPDESRVLFLCTWTEQVSVVFAGERFIALLEISAETGALLKARRLLTHPEFYLYPPWVHFPGSVSFGNGSLLVFGYPYDINIFDYRP